ncbi:MAG: GatB/YqeY domain-containing protein [Candidatus Daviesbacteria bacterium]|nr:GatB/YqeY domain-containing protein [Candidatus Daviesbacteria bacterium]
MLDELQTDLKNAQLARDELKVSTLRLLISEIHNVEIQKGTPVSKEDVILVLQREAKKRKEAASGFRAGGREEAAAKEEAELKILESYLPLQLSNEELTKIVLDTINELGANSPADMGKVIGAVMGKVKGRADGATVSNLAKERLSMSS